MANLIESSLRSLSKPSIALLEALKSSTYGELVLGHHFASRSPSKWLLSACNEFDKIASGTFIDDRFDQDWLSWYGIEKTDIPTTASLDQIICLVLDCIRSWIKANSGADFPKLDEWFFNPRTHRSDFLREFSRMKSQVAAGELYSKYPSCVIIFGKILDEDPKAVVRLNDIVSWYEANKEIIASVSRGAWETSPIRRITAFFEAYYTYLIESTDNGVKALKMGNKAWYDFVAFVRDKYSVELLPTQEMIRNVGSGLGMSFGTTKPKDFYQWDWKKREGWLNGKIDI